MGQELYIFKLDQQLARSHCSPVLRKKTPHSYRKYLKGYPELNFDTILQKVEQDIALMSIDEMWSVYHWFGDINELTYPELDFSQKEDLLYQDMKQNGLDLCFEIPSKTPVSNFYQALGRYESLTNTQINNDCEAADLHRFLDYTICYQGKLNQLWITHYYTNPGAYMDTFYRIESILFEIAEANPADHGLAIREFNKVKDSFIDAIQEVAAFFKTHKRLNQWRTDSEYGQMIRQESDLTNKTALLHYVWSLKDALQGYRGRVKMLHSY